MTEKEHEDEKGGPSGRRHVVGSRDLLAAGERLIVDVAGRSVGIFELDGALYALHNGCPHMGGPVCLGRLGGTTLPTSDYAFDYGLEGRILRCAWHGWEFDITDGRALADPSKRVRTYDVRVESGEIVIYL